MAPPPVRFRGGTVAVSSPDIASLTLVKPLPALARVYIGPWIPAYILSYYAFYHAYDTYIKSIGECLTLLFSSSLSRRWRVFFFPMSLHRSVALFESRWPCAGRSNGKGAACLVSRRRSGPLKWPGDRSARDRRQNQLTRHCPLQSDSLDTQNGLSCSVSCSSAVTPFRSCSRGGASTSARGPNRPMSVASLPFVGECRWIKAICGADRNMHAGLDV